MINAKRRRVIRMNFKQAEFVINASIMNNGPSLLIVGPNRIGKTTMLHAIAEKFKKKVYWTNNADYGGLMNNVDKIKQKDTIIYSDLQTILMRKTSVKNATIGLIASWISDGRNESDDFTYHNSSATLGKNMNFIIACTTDDLNMMMRYKGTYTHLLTRCLIIRVNNDLNIDAIENEERFELSMKPITKINKENKEEAMKVKLDRSIGNFGRAELVRDMERALIAIDCPIEIPFTDIEFFEPKTYIGPFKSDENKPIATKKFVPKQEKKSENE